MTPSASLAEKYEKSQSSGACFARCESASSMEVAAPVPGKRLPITGFTEAAVFGGACLGDVCLAGVCEQMP